MESTGADDLSGVVASTLKFLAIDAVQKANSGHPGMPMGMADAASVMWREILTVDPTAPLWPDRDRFILSAGHGSMLLYGLLHLAGFDLPMEQLQQFRQLHSTTPGHPEVGMTPGVETTTGPLGQGFANAVGFAMAERFLAHRFNRPQFDVVDHMTLGICSDGDLQEGISHEAASLAGHLGLGKIVFLYDDNKITIEGSTSLSWSDDVTARFEGYGWQVLEVDGHNRGAVSEALAAGVAETGRPTLIRCHTHIGHGSPNKQDTASSHGSPLGHAEIELTKQGAGWPQEPTFHVPEAARSGFDQLRARGAAKRAAWQATMERYAVEHPALAAEWAQLHEGDGLAPGIDQDLPGFVDPTKEATRASSGKVLAALADRVPTLWGGSADLAGSNKTTIKGTESHSRETPGGRTIHYGIREHGMAAAMNGMALHGGIIPYGGTFLTFSDYNRPSIRLAALMKTRVVHVFSHDSIFLGEDGPTHQSVEHAAALRMIPGVDVLRPADARETAASWIAALRRTDGPSALLLTRQGVPPIAGTTAAMEGVSRGGYVVRNESGAAADIILIGTGSELHLCTQAADILAADGIDARVVSMPCVDRFERQDAAYRDQVLPSAVPLRLSVEAGVTPGWAPIVGIFGGSIGLDRFGESAPSEVLAEFFGFTVDAVVARATDLVGGFAVRAEARIAELQAAAGRRSR